MVEKHPILDSLTIIFLVSGIFAIGFPIYYTFVAASLTLDQVMQVPMPLIPGDQFFVNLKTAWSRGNLGRLLWNSCVMALGITLGKISVSILSAFAMTYFNFRFRKVAFWMVFLTLMLPIEVRIMPTYEVAANVFSPIQAFFHLFNLEVGLSWSLLDSYFGLTLPLIASATATFLFRQFFLTVPEELSEAAKVDGASPMQFFRKILLPLSKTNMAALFVIIFIYGWNQYLWPLLVTTDPSMKTAIIGIQQLIPTADEVPAWHVAMAGSLVVMLPPILVVIVMQKWFVKGLIDHEK